MLKAYTPNPDVAMAHTLMHCFTPSRETTQILEENKVSFSFDLLTAYDEPAYQPSDVLAQNIPVPDWVKDEKAVREALGALADDLYKINVIDFRFLLEEVADRPDDTHITLFVDPDDLDVDVENLLMAISDTLGLSAGDTILAGISPTNGHYTFPLTEESGIVEMVTTGSKRVIVFPVTTHSSFCCHSVE